MRHEAEGVHPVVDRDQHDTLAGEPVAVVHRDAAPTRSPAAAVDPDHDRQPSVGALGRCPHVQIQTILTHETARACLHAGRSERVRDADAVPRNGRLRRFPPQVGDGRGGERDTPIHRDTIGQLDPGDLTRRELDRVFRSGGGRREEGAQNENDRDALMQHEWAPWQFQPGHDGRARYRAATRGRAQPASLGSVPTTRPAG